MRIAVDARTRTIARAGLALLVAGCGATYGGQPPDGSGLELPPRPPTAEAPAEPVERAAPAPPAATAQGQEAPMFQGLRTVGYYVEDVEEAKAWYSAVLGFGPYFDEPFYVGFNVGGYELGLMPVERGQGRDAGRVIAYWGVPDADVALAHLLAHGAQPNEAVQDVGDGIRHATVRDPFGNIFGVIENPHFELPADD